MALDKLIGFHGEGRCQGKGQWCIVRENAGSLTHGRFPNEGQKYVSESYDKFSEQQQTVEIYNSQNYNKTGGQLRK